MCTPPTPRQNGPTCETMHWRPPGSGLRKYALRQNHTIPLSPYGFTPRVRSGVCSPRTYDIGAEQYTHAFRPQLAAHAVCTALPQPHRQDRWCTASGPVAGELSSGAACSNSSWQKAHRSPGSTAIKRTGGRGHTSRRKRSARRRSSATHASRQLAWARSMKSAAYACMSSILISSDPRACSNAMAAGRIQKAWYRKSSCPEESQLLARPASSTADTPAGSPPDPPGLNVIVPGSESRDGSQPPNEGIQPSHSLLRAAASTRKNGGPKGGSTPKMRRSHPRGKTRRATRRAGARQPVLRSRSVAHCGVSCSMVVRRTEPVPNVIASWAVRRKARMLNKGRPRSARDAMENAKTASPTKLMVMNTVPMRYSTRVAPSNTAMLAHSHRIPRNTPYRKALSTENTAILPRRDETQAIRQASSEATTHAEKQATDDDAATRQAGSGAGAPC
eukprot:scaffold101711_cov72-Phaeocystis_antarctica.AAC.1